MTQAVHDLPVFTLQDPADVQGAVVCEFSGTHDGSELKGYTSHGCSLSGRRIFSREYGY